MRLVLQWALDFLFQSLILWILTKALSNLPIISILNLMDFRFRVPFLEVVIRTSVFQSLILWIPRCCLLSRMFSILNLMDIQFIDFLLHHPIHLSNVSILNLMDIQFKDYSLVWEELIILFQSLFLWIFNLEISRRYPTGAPIGGFNPWFNGYLICDVKELSFNITN